MIAQKTKDLGNGFLDHGAGTLIASARGIVAARDGDGRDVVLVWLMDCRGCFGVLMIDAETGDSQTYPVPIPPGDSPFASVLSADNKLYTLFNSRFVEFDPAQRAFTFVRDTAPKVGMGMTEDDQGRIWTVTYPNSGVVMYDPRGGTFRDYGSVHTENWRQYQRTVAADDTGWVYFALGNTLSQILALHPDAKTAVPLLTEAERVPSVSAHVYRDLDGKVYGLPNQNGSWDGPWYALHGGKAVKMDSPAPHHPKPIVCGLQDLFHRGWASGRRIAKLDLIQRELVVQDPQTSVERLMAFEYTSEGAHFMGVAAAPGGTITGGVAFPMRLASYDPASDTWVDRETYGQSNTVASLGNRFYIGGYTHGFLLEWDPGRPWVCTRKDEPNCNPRLLTDCEPVINRPHALLAYPDGRTIVMGGTPGYGYTGGGLLFWDCETGTRVLLEHTDLLRDQSVMSLAALPDGQLLCGSGTRAGTGGEVRAREAELYVLNMATKKMGWHAPLFPGAQEYSELRTGPGGLVYGLVDFRVYEPTLMDEAKRFFVFDPVRRTVVHQEETIDTFGSMHLQQGQRKIVISPAGTVYLLFRKGIAVADPVTFKLSWLVESPVSINTGGDWLDGRIYFVSGSHLYSYQVAKS